MKKLSIFLVFSALLSGCSEIFVLEKGVKEVVSLYCAAPKEARTLNRINANRIIYPNQIEITCADSL